jgi:hypothetical protein
MERPRIINLDLVDGVWRMREPEPSSRGFVIAKVSIMVVLIAGVGCLDLLELDHELTGKVLACALLGAYWSVYNLSWAAVLRWRRR